MPSDIQQGACKKIPLRQRKHLIYYRADKGCFPVLFSFKEVDKGDSKGDCSKQEMKGNVEILHVCSENKPLAN